MAYPTIAVIGAGFSGTLLSLHLLRQAPPGTRIRLIERSNEFGPGRAYSTDNPNHLLNVPAGRMSAFHDRNLDFLDWLRRRPAHELVGVVPHAGSFVPRRLYGAYIRHLLNDALCGPQADQLELVRASVEAMTHEPHALRLHADWGPAIVADVAVLALGNFTPEPIPVADSVFYVPKLYSPDPWSADSLADLDPTAPVLLIGTGLTMVDAVISLLDQGHVGPIHAVSRRGLLPRSHTPQSSAPVPEPLAYPAGLCALTRFLRQEAERSIACGGSWHSVVDGLRPFTQDVWQAMPIEERGRFLRHLRTWWDVHRHRIAAPVAERIAAARASGQLRIHAGRMRGYRIADGRMIVRYRPRSYEYDHVLSVARVVNCSGPGTDYDRIVDPLVRSLLRDGMVRPDALRLGLDVTDTCALRSRSGAVSQRLFAAGPVTKGTFWEITAVPDIRRQCEVLARNLANLVNVSVQEPSYAL